MGEKGVQVMFIGDEIASFFKLSDSDFKLIEAEFNTNKKKGQYFLINNYLINMNSVKYIKLCR